jgi:hypothetical protein
MIQIYRYIDNVLISSSNYYYNSLLPTFHYNYNGNKYNDDLKNKKFDKSKLLNISDFNSLLFLPFGILLIIIVIVKYFLNINLILKNEKIYKIILIFGILIYLILFIKSLVKFLSE